MGGKAVAHDALIGYLTRTIKKTSWAFCVVDPIRRAFVWPFLWASRSRWQNQAYLGNNHSLVNLNLNLDPVIAPPPVPSSHHPPSSLPAIQPSPRGRPRTNPFWIIIATCDTVRILNTNRLPASNSQSMQPPTPLSRSVRRTRVHSFATTTTTTTTLTYIPLHY